MSSKLTNAVLFSAAPLPIEDVLMSHDGRKLQLRRNNEKPRYKQQLAIDPCLVVRLLGKVVFVETKF